MCGRTACTLNPDQISKAARYRNSKGRDVNPKWRKGDPDKYHPSYNKAPMSFCPVLLHAKHLEKAPTGQTANENNDEEDQTDDGHERVITSMKWGLLPPWVKDPTQAQYKMNNARSDSMLTKVSYKRPLEKGQRCVVLADGFYEWNTTKTEKQPYYIYFKDSEADGMKVKVEVKEENYTDEQKGTENGSSKMHSDTDNKRILTMAGIFERRKSPDEENEDDLYTFSVITVDSHPDFTWLHHRMPAMLENEEEVRRWLDFGEVPLNEAVELIKPKDCLSWYPVSKIVNNSRNNVPECMERIDLSKPKAEKMTNESKGMAKWLAQSSNKTKQEPTFPNNNNNSTKNIKLEPIIKKETRSPAKAQKSPVKSPKKGQKRASSGSISLMEGWLKKAKKD